MYISLKISGLDSWLFKKMSTNTNVWLIPVPGSFSHRTTISGGWNGGSGTEGEVCRSCVLTDMWGSNLCVVSG